MKEEVARSLRAFLTVQISPEIHARLVSLKDELARSGADVRWVRETGLHATVIFLGSIEAPTLEQIHQQLAVALRSLRPFDVRVSGLGVFPNLRRPRVVWAGLHSPKLPALARETGAVTARFGFPPEERPFEAHITLGRVKSPRGWPRLEKSLEAHWQDELGRCMVSELTAYRSDLRPDGAVYTKLWSIPFANQEGEPHGTGSQS